MQLKIQALGGEFAAVTVVYVGLAPNDFYLLTSATFGRESAVIITDAGLNNCADDLKIGIANDGSEATGFEDYHIPMTSDPWTPTAPRCSAFKFTVARDVTCSAIELMVRHDRIAFPNGSFWVALYSGATADALVQLAVFGSLEGARVPWSEYSLVYFGLTPGVAEVDLAPGTNYWIGLCSGDPTDPVPPPAEQWRDAALWVMKSIDGAVGDCALDNVGVHRPEDWGIGDFNEPATVSPWFRLYQRKTVLRVVPASPHVVLPSIGEKAVMERVGGDHPYRQISAARAGLSSAGAFGRGASGSGSSGAGPGISSALGLTAGGVVYATGASTVAAGADLTWDSGTNQLAATGSMAAPQLISPQIGPAGDLNLLQLAANALTVNGAIGTQGTAPQANYGWSNDGAYHAYFTRAGHDTWGLQKSITDGNCLRFINFGSGSIFRLVDTGDLTLNPDTDVSATLGRAKVGFMGTADNAAFGHYDHFTLASCALRQVAGGNTVLNAVATIYHRIGNAGGLAMSAAALYPAVDSAMTLGTAAGPKYFLNVFTDELTLMANSTISGRMRFDIPVGQSYAWWIGGAQEASLSALEFSMSGTINTTVSYEVDGTKVVGNQGAAIGDLAIAAAWDPVGIAKVNQIIARLKASTGHGLVAG